MVVFEKLREHPPGGSIPEALDMFRSEVRFYREVAPVVGVRVPRCFEASITADGTVLRLEDLSAWSPGADPLGVVSELRHLHDRWQGEATARWPWLRSPGAAADLIGDLYDRTWPRLAAREDLSPEVRRLGESLVGCVAEAELAEGTAGPLTLCHGDTSMRNLATSPEGGQIAFLDWEDVRSAPGVTDLAWFLLSSVHPDGWNDLESEYGESLDGVLPSVSAQGFFALADHSPDTPTAAAWISRLAGAADRLRSR